MVEELRKQLFSELAGSDDFCEDVISWFSIRGIQIWITPYFLSSSGGWAYNIRKWREGQLVFELSDMASSTSLSRSLAYREAFNVALTKL